MQTLTGLKLEPLVRFKPSSMEFGRAKELEWIIPNKLGGYSSSTILGLNTSRFHGLLISGGKFLKRTLCLNSLYEDIHTKEGILSLEAAEYGDGSLGEGYRYLTDFEFSYSSVGFRYSLGGVRILKRIAPLFEKNAVSVIYNIKNRSADPIKLRLNPVVSFRAREQLCVGDSTNIKHKIFSQNIAAVESEKGYLVLYSDKASFHETPPCERLREDISYSGDKEAGENHSEDLYQPLYLDIAIEPLMDEDFLVVALGYETEVETAQAFKEFLNGGRYRPRFISSGAGGTILSLLSAAGTFIVDSDSKKTVIAGFPHSGERGREAMISLLGLTLVKGEYDTAKSILEHFLNRAGRDGIPSGFLGGKAEYRDIDTSLWMIDRMYQYMNGVGAERFKGLLHTYWWTLKSMMRNYLERERNGLLMHEGGTWMDPLERNNAVEVQGLWYNALRIMERFADLMEDTVDDINLKSIYVNFEENFPDRYWNGRYLSDCLDDNSLRPNQIIPLSLEFNVIDGNMSRKILGVVERDLLTRYGLRTLSPSDHRYVGDSRFNGGVHPWLLGSYVGAYIKAGGGRTKIKQFLQPLFEEHIYDAGLGSISEFFDGNPPHKPRGCISHSTSVGELLRIYFEHKVY